MNIKQRVIIVNDQDEIIGYKERGTLDKDDIYRVSALWITNSDGHILLARRKLTKKHDPGKWGPAVAGTVEEGESYVSNILKEAAEELGITDIRPLARQRRRVKGEYTYFVQWYTLVIDKAAQDFAVQEEEVEEVRWFAPEELKRQLQDNQENYLVGLADVMKMFA